MKLPKVLVIDDQLGRGPQDGMNRDREAFCAQIKLRDVTGDGCRSQQFEDSAAEVHFLSGQIVDKGMATNDIAHTLEAVGKGWNDNGRWALVFVDLHFSAGTVGENGAIRRMGPGAPPQTYHGLDLLEAIARDPRFGSIPLVVLSSMDRGDIEKRMGRVARAFVSKSDLTGDRFRRLIVDHGLIEDGSGLIIGRSVNLLEALRVARARARRGTENILVLGENGVGKELFARYIHWNSPRRRGPLVPVQLRETEAQHVESRLFGHVRGAYTDARTARDGAVKEASGGTLFLDEFGEIPDGVQMKLQRLLDSDTREYTPLGSETVKKAGEMQIVMCTNNMDLADPSSSGFRQDILNRVGLPITIPPLRERGGDIRLLVDRFLPGIESTLGADRREVDPEVYELLSTYSWQGNVRELRFCLEDAVRAAPGIRVLVPEHLPDRIRNARRVTVGSAQTRDPARVENVAVSEPTASTSLDALIAELRDLSVEGSDGADIRGKLPELRSAAAAGLAELLRAALEVTRDPVNEQLVTTKAVRLLLGRSTLSTAEAYDEVKRIVKVSPDDQSAILKNPVVREAFEAATKNRSRKSQMRG